jgi:methionine salvage enolase-phosphatase E1
MKRLATRHALLRFARVAELKAMQALAMDLMTQRAADTHRDEAQARRDTVAGAYAAAMASGTRLDLARYQRLGEAIGVSEQVFSSASARADDAAQAVATATVALCERKEATDTHDQRFHQLTSAKHASKVARERDDALELWLAVERSS